MSRREYNINNKIEYLKSIGCQFYAPLDYNNTFDLISGNQMIIQGTNTVIWDNTLNMYIFEDTNCGVSIARWANLSMNFDISNIEFTMLYNMTPLRWGNNPYTTDDTDQIAPLGLGYNNNVTMQHQAVGSVLNENLYAAFVMPKYNGSSRNETVYKNGNLINTINRGTNIYTGNSYTNSSVCSGGSSIRPYQKYALKECYFFNTILTLETIKEIQGL